MTTNYRYERNAIHHRRNVRARRTGLSALLYAILSVLFSEKAIETVKYTLAFIGFVVFVAFVGMIEAGGVSLGLGFAVCVAIGISLIVFFKPKEN